MTTVGPDKMPNRAPGGQPDACHAARAVTADAGKPAPADRPLIPRRRPARRSGCSRCSPTTAGCGPLHALEHAGQLRVTDLADTVGTRPQALSNQFQRLADRRIVAARRDRTTSSTASPTRERPARLTSGCA